MNGHLAEPPMLGEFNGHEIYPMPMFAKIAVMDVESVAGWYGEALGFAVIFQAPGADGKLMLVHLRRKKYQDQRNAVSTMLQPLIKKPA